MGTFATQTKRDTINQSVHDRVVEELAIYWHNPAKYNITTNPGSLKRRWVGSVDNFPDLVGWVTIPGGEQAVWIAEVETSSTVTSSEAQKQWAKYDATGVPFHLVVPAGYSITAKEIAARLELSIAGFYEFSFPNGGFSLKQV